MKISANSFLWTETFTTNDFGILDQLAAAGLDGVEIGLLDPSTLPAKELREALEERQLACTICCVIPRDASLIAQDSAERERGRQHVGRCIQIAAQVGATTLCGPLYSPVGVEASYELSGSLNIGLPCGVLLKRFSSSQTQLEFPMLGIFVRATESVTRPFASASTMGPLY